MPLKTLPLSGALLSMPSTLESSLRRSTRQKSNRAAMDISVHAHSPYGCFIDTRLPSRTRLSIAFETRLPCPDAPPPVAPDNTRPKTSTYPNSNRGSSPANQPGQLEPTVYTGDGR